MDDIIRYQNMLETVVDYKEILDGDEKFLDTQFLPTFESIFSNKQTKFVWNEDKQHYKKSKIEYEETVGWIRLSELYDISDMTIVENVSPLDVKQGYLGD